MSDERMMILTMVKDGKISIEEAERLLSVIEKGEHTSSEGDPVRGEEKDGEKTGNHDPWGELGNYWERFGSEMETFWKDFGATVEEHMGQKFSRKLERFAEQFGESMKHVSKDWAQTAGDAIHQVFDSLGIDADIIVSVDDKKAKVEQSYRYDLPLDGPETVRIRNISGGIDVVGSDEDVLHCAVDVTVAAESEERARALLDAMSFEPERRDGVIAIGISIDDGSPLTRSMSCKFHVSVPRRCPLVIDQIKGDVTLQGSAGAVDLTLKKGDVSCDGMTGPMTILVTKGDVSVRNCEADARIQITKGDISCTEMSGLLNGHLVKGDVSVEKMRGDVRLRTTMGDVSIDDSRGDIDVATARGDIAISAISSKRFDVNTSRGDQSIRFSPDQDGDYRLTAQHGDIRLQLPGTLAAEFDIRVSSGTLTTNVLTTKSNRAPFSIKEVIGRGGARFTIDLVRGDLEVIADGTSADGDPTAESIATEATETDSDTPSNETTG